MKFISLFSGIGGFDLGFERAGMECVAQVEIDPFCNKVLEKHWPDVPRYKDVKDVGKHNLPAADVICGGFPCQPHSLAGQRKASTDERDLWPEFSRIVDEIKPRWVVAENVRGLLSSEAGRFFGRVLRDLAASGYCIEWQLLPASAFGAPHQRERVIIVAHSDADSIGWNTGKSPAATGANEIGVYALGRLEGLGQDVPNSHKPRLEGKITTRQSWQYYGLPAQCSWWDTEPGLGRVADGLPGRVDRLKGLGNALVPEEAEWIGRRIMAVQP
jgi:DNA (cytosine-5)-methyltransferase 1